MPVFGANVPGIKGMIPLEPGLSLIKSMGQGYVMKLLTFPERSNVTVNQALSDFIPMDHVIIDTLHLFLRISDNLSKRTFQGNAVVKSEKAWDSCRRSRAKFNVAARLGVLHS